MYQKKNTVERAQSDIDKTLLYDSYDVLEMKCENT